MAGFPLAVTITGFKTSASQRTSQDVNPQNPVYLSCKFNSRHSLWHRLTAFRFWCLMKVVDICIKIFPLDSSRPQNLNYFFALLWSKLDWSSSRPNTHVMQTWDVISAVAGFTNNRPSDYHLPVYSLGPCRVCVKAVLFYLTDLRSERLCISISRKGLSFRF